MLGRARQVWVDRWWCLFVEGLEVDTLEEWVRSDAGVAGAVLVPGAQSLRGLEHDQLADQGLGQLRRSRPVSRNRA